MLALRGIYENGQVHLSETVPVWVKRAEVIITILDEIRETESEDHETDVSIFDDMIGVVNGHEDDSVEHDRCIIP